MTKWTSTLMLGVASVSLLCAHADAAEPRVGITSAVNPSAVGTPPDGAARPLVIGGDVIFRERVVTTADGQAQLLFLDQSALMVGPNSQVVIDEFVFDPNAGKGSMAATLAQGSFRYIGGKLSKQGNATLRTPVATIGIRGTDVTVIYDVARKFLDVITTNGTARVETAGGVVNLRTGFHTTVNGEGQAPSSPEELTAEQIAAANGQFEGQSGKSAGAPRIPTDLDVAGSDLGSVVEARRLAGIAPAAGGTRTVATTLPLFNRVTEIANDIVATGTQDAATQTGSSTPVGGDPHGVPPPPPTGSRTEQALNGYVGGIGQGFIGDSMPTTYMVANSVPTDVLIQTLPSQGDGQVYVKLQFHGVAAEGSAPLSAATVELGDPPGNPSGDRSIYQNDAIFFATQRASAETVTTAIGDEERNASIDGVGAGSSAYLYTVGLVDLQNFRTAFPGVNFCACEYVTWGFWGGELRGPVGNDRLEYVPLGTWVAGKLPNVNDPTPQGSATFSGHAIGTVMRDGAMYMAAGNFTNDYNFGSRRGNVSIQNFDGHNVSGTVMAGQDWRHYSGSLAGSGLTGDIRGSFYGNRSATGQLFPQNQPKETAGNFTLNGGGNYMASGIFAGKR